MACLARKLIFMLKSLTFPPIIAHYIGLVNEKAEGILRISSAFLYGIGIEIFYFSIPFRVSAAEVRASAILARS